MGPARETVAAPCRLRTPTTRTELLSSASCPAVLAVVWASQPGTPRSPSTPTGSVVSSTRVFCLTITRTKSWKLAGIRSNLNQPVSRRQIWSSELRNSKILKTKNMSFVINLIKIIRKNKSDLHLKNEENTRPCQYLFSYQLEIALNM